MNKSGIEPIQGRVLILPDEVSDTMGENDMLIKPIIAKDQEQMAQTRGTLVAAGEDAFKYEDGELWGDAPKIGDKVLISRYAGKLIFSLDETLERPKQVEYRLCNDSDITAKITGEKEITGR